MAHLVVSKGTGAGGTIHLAKVTCLGRGLDMDVRLDELTVSKRHARIIRDDRGEYILEDLASSNGTFLNGVEITTKPLKDGDELRIGSTVFVFHKSTSDTSYIGVEEDGKLIDIGEQDSASSVVSRVDMTSASGDALAAKSPADTTVEELVKTNYRLRTMLEIAQSIGSALDEDELLDRIVEKLFEVFPETNRGFIILREPETERLIPRAQKVTGAGAESEERLQISETILEYVLEQKQAILSTDLMSDERLPTSQSILDFDMRSVMCAPLLYEDEVLGFIQLDTSRIANNYDDDGLHLLAGIANQAALTIANARLHDQLVKRERLEQDLRNARRIQTSFLPKEPPKVDSYTFANYYGTALEVGGDFYDTVAVGDQDVLVTVGDVSGKGITAALMMAVMASNLRFFAGSRMAPGRAAGQAQRGRPQLRDGHVRDRPGHLPRPPRSRRQDVQRRPLLPHAAQGQRRGGAHRGGQRLPRRHHGGRGVPGDHLPDRARRRHLPVHRRRHRGDGHGGQAVRLQEAGARHGERRRHARGRRPGHPARHPRTRRRRPPERRPDAGVLRQGGQSGRRGQ